MGPGYNQPSDAMGPVLLLLLGLASSLTASLWLDELAGGCWMEKKLEHDVPTK